MKLFFFFKKNEEVYYIPLRTYAIESVLDLIITLVLYTLLAGDQWPRTSGGRLRFAHAITHLLGHRFGHFVSSNK